MIPFPRSPSRTIYLAGPMQGQPEFNFPLFHAVAWALRNDGHYVFSPAERDIERHGGVDISKGNLFGSLDKAKGTHGFSLRQALADDTNFICLEANTIVILPDWEKSNGVQAEQRLGVALKTEGMTIEYMSKTDADIILIAHQEWLACEKEQADAAE